MVKMIVTITNFIGQIRKLAHRTRQPDPKYIVSKRRSVSLFTLLYVTKKERYFVQSYRL